MKIASAILVLILLLSSFVVLASDGVVAAQSGDYTYEVSGSPAVATIIKYTGSGGAITIPSTLGGYATAIIDDDAFSYSHLTSVIIPNSTKSLGYSSFYRCIYLASVTIGSGVTNISYGAFYACTSLKSITFLGLVAPTTIGGDWVLYTDPGIRGHAYAASNFPPPGGNFNGLVMGNLISVPASPGAPTALAVRSGMGYLSLTWNAPLDVGYPALTRYDVYRGTVPGTYIGPIGSTAAGLLAYNDTTVTPGIQYFYIVRAVNSVGSSLPSNYASGTANIPPTVPSAPLNTMASSGVGSARLTWSPPASDGGSAITNYKVYRGTVSSEETLLVTLGDVLAYTDNGLTNGQTYWYEVSAVNAVGEGARSNEVSATPSTVPSSPRDLHALASDSEVNLSWTAPLYVGPGTIIYHLFRNGSLFWSGTAQTYRDIAVTNGFTYSYKVVASNSLGWGLNSTSLMALPLGAPEAPLSLHATIGTGFINLTWSPPSNDGGSPIQIYKMFRNPVPTPTVPWIINASSGMIWYNDTSVKPGTNYEYSVIAFNQVGESDVSSVVATAEPIPTSPGIDWLPFVGIAIALVVVAGAAFMVIRKRK